MYNCILELVPSFSKLDRIVEFQNIHIYNSLPIIINHNVYATTKVESINFLYFFALVGFKIYSSSSFRNVDEIEFFRL